jgi:membrane-associated phospholipid phosphatase
LSRAAAIVAAILTLTVMAIFALRPDLDLAMARWFHEPDGFAGSGQEARMLRNFLFALPIWIFAAALIRALILWRRGVPGTGRRFLFLALTMALGPGLLVNGILKDHSHRPRPAQTQEFGGTAEFRPWTRFDGACRTNCSFVSGETSAAAWLLAPASLAPPPLRLPIMGAAVAVTVVTGVARMAFGGHYLSDVLLAALFTWLLCQGLTGLLLRPPPKDRDPAS